jgi:multiple sugar transport system substrate-binding protein
MQDHQKSKGVNMMKRHSLLSLALPMLLVVAMLAVSVSACAPATPAPTSAPVEEPEEEAMPEPPTEEAQPETAEEVSQLVAASMEANIDWRQFEGTELNALVVKHWWTDAIEPLLPDFEALTGMTVKFDTLSEDTYFQKAVTELSSGSGAHDVLMVGNQQVGQYMNSGWLEPMNDYFANPALTDLEWYDKDDLLQSGLKAGSVGDTQFALPIGAEAEILMYRKDIFEEQGIQVPTTYDELYDVAMTLNSDDMAGYVSRGKRGLDVIWEWTGYLLSYGGRYFDENGMPAFNSPEGVAATQMYADLLNNAGPEGTINWSWMECSQNFAQGNSAMYVEAGGIGPVVDAEENPVYGKVGYATMPQFEDKPVIPNYWFWMIGMPAGGENKDAAFLFIEWATSKTLGKPLSAGGSSPARSSVWSSEEILTWANPEWAAASLAALDQVQPKLVPYDRADYPEIVDAISAEINNVQEGVKTAQQAMDDAAVKVEKIVSQSE